MTHFLPRRIGVWLGSVSGLGSLVMLSACQSPLGAWSQWTEASQPRLAEFQAQHENRDVPRRANPEERDHRDGRDDRPSSPREHDREHDGKKAKTGKKIPIQIGHPGPGHEPGPGQGPRPVPRPEPGMGNPGGERCNASDSLCLALKYVVYQDRLGDQATDDRDVAHTVREVNQIWRDCGIQFQVERYLPIDPGRYQLRYRTADYQELNEIRQAFMDDQTLLVVATGTWNRLGTLGNTWANAWTNLPGEGVYGAVLEQSVGSVANVVAHELGHYLSLGHADDPRSLMHPVIFQESTTVTREQCEDARWAVQQYWKGMLR